jgi:F0F1-type ATP synthase alpha subunit
VRRERDEFRLHVVGLTLSVTRVGRKTQTPFVRQINREILSLLSQFRNLNNISHLDAELSFESKEILAQGRSLMGMLHQNTGIIPYDIQIILFGIIWLKLADLSKEQVYQPILQGLLEIYSNPAERTGIKQITSSKDIPTFLSLLKQRTDIIELCKKNLNSPVK